MVDVFKGKLLNLVKYVMPQVLCVSCASSGRIGSGFYAEPERQHCHDDQNDPHLDNVRKIPVLDPNIDNLCHLKRNQHFHEDFQNDK